MDLKLKYSKTRGIAIRYGICLDMFDSIFIKHHKEDIYALKRMIIDEAIISEPLKHISNNILIDSINDLERNERMVLNLIMDDYSYNEVSQMLNIENIESLYTNTINKLKKNEKIITQLGSDIVNSNERIMSVVD